MKQLYCTLALCLCITIAGAQNVKRISYTQEENLGLRNLMDLIDVTNLNLKITGEFANKKLQLIEHTVIDGKETVRSIPFPSPKDSILYISVLSRLLPENKIQLQIFIEATPGNRISSTKRGISMEKNCANYLLIETYPTEAYAQNDVPLFAFTAGLEKKIEFNGQFASYLDYCGLRDAHVAPNLWVEQFGLLYFVYYSLRFD